GESEWITVAHGIVPQRRRNGSWTVTRLVRVESRLAFGCHWGNIVHHKSRSPSQPYATEVVRIVRRSGRDLDSYSPAPARAAVLRNVLAESDRTAGKNSRAHDERARTINSHQRAPFFQAAGSA